LEAERRDALSEPPAWVKTLQQQKKDEVSAPSGETPRT